MWTRYATGTSSSSRSFKHPCAACYAKRQSYFGLDHLLKERRCPLFLPPLSPSPPTLPSLPAHLPLPSPPPPPPLPPPSPPPPCPLPLGYVKRWMLIHLTPKPNPPNPGAKAPGAVITPRPARRRIGQATQNWGVGRVNRSCIGLGSHKLNLDRNVCVMDLRFPVYLCGAAVGGREGRGSLGAVFRGLRSYVCLAEVFTASGNIGLVKLQRTTCNVYYILSSGFRVWGLCV